MITVAEAEKIILDHSMEMMEETVPLMESLNLVLAEDVYADRDFPPFDRVAMDGYAIVFETFKTGQRTFKVEGIQPAGEAQKKMINVAHAFEVMTGAILPEGTDTVIRYEDCQTSENTVTVRIDDVRSGQNVHDQGFDRKKDDVLILAGTRISSAEIPVMATVGKVEVAIRHLDEVAIVSSGDELVEISETPLPHQIRRSNSYAIKALMDQHKIPSFFYHLPDQFNAIEKELKNIFKKHRIVILSGGVSMGKFDYIPDVLAKLDVKKCFHKVEQRPGKPFWFGYNADTTVFALPGNPVSAFVCTLRYFIPWVMQCYGIQNRPEYAKLEREFKFKPNLTNFLQVKLENRRGEIVAIPQPGRGSGDLANLVNADGFLELPAGREHFEKGEVFRLWRW